MKLSICIPTYNQPDKLKRTLESLKGQITKDVEVLIEDDTNNPNRRGLDGALISLTKRAKGDFIWWIGDDIVKEGAVKKILSLIDNCDFIWLNNHEIYKPSSVTFQDRTEHFITADKIIKTDLGLTGFITATLFRRSIALECLDNAEQFVGTAWVCMYIVLYVLSKGKPYYLGTPYFMSESKPPGEKRWYDQFDVFCINLKKITDNFYFPSLNYAIRKNLVKCIKAVLYERTIGLCTGFASHRPKIVPLLKTYPTYWEAWIGSLLFLIPRKILMRIHSFLER